MAFTVFNKIPNGTQSTRRIGSMMKCLNENNRFEESMNIFENSFVRVRSGIAADAVMLNMYLSACISSMSFNNGARIIKQYSLGMPGMDPKYSTVELLSQLIRFYTARGEIRDVDNAVAVFNSIPKDKHDTITVGSIMKCLNEHRKYLDAMRIFETASTSTSTDTDIVNGVTLNLYLSACIGSKSFNKGENIIDKYLLGMPDSENKFKTIELLNQVINFYSSIKDFD